MRNVIYSIANVVGVLKEVLIGYANINPDEDNGEYFDNVLQMINNSNVSDDIKLQLKGGVIIGQASNHLWYTKRNISDPVEMGRY